MRPATPPLSSEPPSTKSAIRRILVAEEHVVKQRVVGRFLARIGYQRDVVTNGAEAVDAVNRLSYPPLSMDY